MALIFGPEHRRFYLKLTKSHIKTQYSDSGKINSMTSTFFNCGIESSQNHEIFYLTIWRFSLMISFFKISQVPFWQGRGEPKPTNQEPPRETKVKPTDACFIYLTAKAQKEKEAVIYGKEPDNVLPILRSRPSIPSIKAGGNTNNVVAFRKGGGR